LLDSTASQLYALIPACVLFACTARTAESGAPLLPGIPSAPSGSLSPAAAAAAAATAAGQQQDQQDPDQQQQGTQPPLRIIDGPSTNPEPPPEGLSPPLTRDPLDSNMGSEAGEELPAALYALPSELRDPPPGQL
jgi:hypothetical protein